MPCNHLVSADVVTADARPLTPGATEYEDLFWTIRGGGGNFGMVTSFEFALHELQPMAGGTAMYPQSQLREVFHFSAATPRPHRMP